LRTLVKKLLEAALPRASERMRPGRGRKRSSLSRLIGAGRYRYYSRSTKARQGETGCRSRTVLMEKLDPLVADHIEHRLLQPSRVEKILSSVLDRREERFLRSVDRIVQRLAA
jgi:hypothetical protein